MLRVLGLMATNVSKGPSTVPFPGEVPTPGGYRGPVRMDAARCLTCGICAYVCVSRAITGGDEESHYQWRYDPGRCTFCARCAERCPGQALSLDPAPLAPYARQGDHAAGIAVPWPVCPECGKGARNAPQDWLNYVFPEAGARTRELMRLCLRCRRKQLMRGLKPGTEEVV